MTNIFFFFKLNLSTSTSPLLLPCHYLFSGRVYPDTLFWGAFVSPREIFADRSTFFASAVSNISTPLSARQRRLVEFLQIGTNFFQILFICFADFSRAVLFIQLKKSLRRAYPEPQENRVRISSRSRDS